MVFDASCGVAEVVFGGESAVLFTEASIDCCKTGPASVPGGSGMSVWVSSTGSMRNIYVVRWFAC